MPSKGSLKNDITGLVFNRLTVLSFEGRNKGADSLWMCRCSCGNKLIIRGGVLKNGHTQSCGCLQKERASETKFIHGSAKKGSGQNGLLYKVWNSMKYRCNTPSNKNYHNYGGRGISVCNEWETNFMSFYDWAYSNGYKVGLTIERIDVNGNYSPSNCKWITRTEQTKNTRNTVRISLNGTEKSIFEWVSITSIPRNVLYQRIKRGWTSERTLTTKYQTTCK